VVSTGTKTLQDQIATVDLPRLRAMFDRAGLLPAPLEWAVMKGLSNYVCRRRLGERDRQRSLIEEPEWTGCSPCGVVATGDRADLSDPTTRRCGATSRRRPVRIGPRCAFFESCRDRCARRRAADHREPPPVLRGPAARALARSAGVAAHHDVVIFDEAHR
jgi:Rad3-related DNA helicase